MKLKSLLDPLRLFSFFNICGDILLMMSGGYFYNPVRSAAAALGLVSSSIGTIFGSKHLFKIFTFRIAAGDMVMAIIMICGCLYVLSGSNLLGFEQAPRYSEIGLGLLVAAGAVALIFGKSTLAMIIFIIPPFLNMSAAFESWAAQGHFDPFQFTAGFCFMIAGFAAKFIKKPQKDKVTPANTAPV